MTSYLVLYTTRWASVLEQNQAKNRRFPWFRLGLLPHEIGALNARYARRKTARGVRAAAGDGRLKTALQH